jgi:hypothetical protein
MNNLPVASLMAREAVRNKVTRPQPESPPRRPRRAVAVLLQAAAHRLDPCVAAPTRAVTGR